MTSSARWPALALLAVSLAAATASAQDADPKQLAS